MTPETKTKILKYILTPLSWIYGSVTAVRNWMFDNRILPQEEFGVPIVSVGNLTVGGTGKTPHTEYIVGMLAMDYNTAVLSRGYKRKTKGLFLRIPTVHPTVWVTSHCRFIVSSARVLKWLFAKIDAGGYAK